jgi:hypothetical protein
MKIVVKKFFLLFAFLLGAICAIAGNSKNPPTPNPYGKSAAVPIGPIGPIGLPIDDNSLMLLIVALLFGIYIIYKRTIKEKASI